MTTLDRRTFLKIVGGGTAALGMGFPTGTWNNDRRAWAAEPPGRGAPGERPEQVPPNPADFRPNWDEWELYYPGKYNAEDQKVLDAWYEELYGVNSKGDIDIDDLVSGKLEGQPGIGRVQKIEAAGMDTNAGNWGAFNPIWSDPEYVKKTKWGRRFAIPYTVAGQMGVPAMPKNKGIGDYMMVSNYNVSGKFLKPVYEGDTLYSVTDKSEAIDITPSQGSHYRTWAVIGWGRTFNQRGELVGEGAGIRTESFRRHIDKSKRNASGEHIWESPDWFSKRPIRRYTDDDYDHMKSIWEKEEIRGSSTRYWDDVNIGDEVTPRGIGPWVNERQADMSFTIPKWCTDTKLNVTDPNIFKTMVKNKQGIYVPPQYVERKPPAGNYGSTTASGLMMLSTYDGRSLLMNAVGAYWAAGTVANWMGDDGWLQRLGWVMMENAPGCSDAVNYREDPTRVPNPMNFKPALFDQYPYLTKVPGMQGKYAFQHGMEGDFFITKATVIGKYREGDEYFVDLIYWVETLEKYIVEEGNMTVKLPKR